MQPHIDVSLPLFIQKTIKIFFRLLTEFLEAALLNFARRPFPGLHWPGSQEGCEKGRGDLDMQGRNSADNSSTSNNGESFLYFLHRRY